MPPSPQEEQQPYVPKELLQHLENAYPNKCPSPDDSDRAIWMDVGIQVVISRLRAMYRDQEEDLL